MRRIARVVTRKQLHDTDDDYLYWIRMSPGERIAMVQELRAEYHGWDDAAGPRLQRVHRVLHRE